MHRVIGTTGPDMTRFFFTVDEAVALVETAMEGLLSRSTKSALIRDVLETWVAEKGGKWETIAGRPGERNQEFLIGDLELPYPRAVSINGVTHYLMPLNEKVPIPLERAVCSNTAERLTHAELKPLVFNPPARLLDRQRHRRLRLPVPTGARGHEGQPALQPMELDVMSALNRRIYLRQAEQG